LSDVVSFLSNGAGAEIKPFGIGIEEKLGVKGEIWTWGPEEFKKSPSWTGL
jgi:hypothetical protein